MRLLACTVVTLLLTPASASASGWLTPEFIWLGWGSSPSVAAGPEGNAAIAWRDHTAASIEVVTRGGAGERWVPSRVSSAEDRAPIAPVVAEDASGNVTVVWFDWRSEGDEVIRSAYRPAGGLWSPPVDVARTFYGPGYTLAAAEPGTAIVLSVRRREGTTGYDQNVLRAHVRRADGSFAPAQDLSREEYAAGVEYIEIATNAVGDAVVAWTSTVDRVPRVEAAVRPRGGTFGPPMILSKPGQKAFDPQVAIDDAGNAIVAWTRFDGLGCWSGMCTVQLARKRAGSNSFEAAQEVPEGGLTSSASSVALRDDGTAVLLFARWAPTQTTLEALSIAPLGARAAHLLGPHASWIGSFVAATPGGAVAVWDSLDPQPGVLAAELSPSGWTPTHAITAEGSRGYEPDVAIDAGGNVVVAWAEYLGGATMNIQKNVLDVSPPSFQRVRFPRSPRARARATFSARGYDAWSAPIFTWRFGDGRTAEGPDVRHVYRRAGRYRVTLTATDACGNATSRSRTIVVRPRGTSG